MNSKRKKRNFIIKLFCISVLVLMVSFISVSPVHASSTSKTNSSVTSDNPNEFELKVNTNDGSTGLTSSLQVLLILTVLSLAPSILIMVTSFTRIIIVLHFTRSALGTQTTPPNQVLIGLALFLTFFIMSPVISEVNQNAVQPLVNKQITQEQAIEAGLKPIRAFMFKQTNEKDIKLFLEVSKNQSEIKSQDDIKTSVLIPAFIISELRKAFIIGFVIYLPFIIMDMVVASTLMSMGMMMLPPTTISMPFKILLFVLADGWNLVIGQVVKTFY